MKFSSVVRIPGSLAASCAKTPERQSWLARLPEIVGRVKKRWSLTIGDPFDGEEVSAAWVAPVWRSDNTPAVMKIGMPHFENLDEIEGLQFWNGDVTVRLLEFDTDLGAMLLERCEPGTHLRALPETDQDVVIAPLLRRLWRTSASFRPLSALIEHWSEETWSQEVDWPDSGLVRRGLEVWNELLRTTTTEVALVFQGHDRSLFRSHRT